MLIPTSDSVRGGLWELHAIVLCTEGLDKADLSTTRYSQEFLRLGARTCIPQIDG